MPRQRAMRCYAYALYYGALHCLPCRRHRCRRYAADTDAACRLPLLAAIDAAAAFSRERSARVPPRHA